jgi:hypothetical protein
VRSRRPADVGTGAMKITDVTLTLFAWPSIPPTMYGRHTGPFGGDGSARTSSC